MITTKKVAIGGMISSGKSSLLEGLKEKLGMRHVLNGNGWLFLDEFREDDSIFDTMLRWLYEGEEIELQLQTYFIEKHYKAARTHDMSQLNSELLGVAEALKEIGTDEAIYTLSELKKQFKDVERKVVVDRDIIEHWLFAHAALKGKDDYILMFYNNLFHSMYTKHHRPDLYIILDINWETFEKRIMDRGRPQEVDNFDKNIDYFKELIEMYKSKLVAQCTIYDVPYVIIDANDKTKEQVLDEAMQLIEENVGL